MNGQRGAAPAAAEIRLVGAGERRHTLGRLNSRTHAPARATGPGPRPQTAQATPSNSWQPPGSQGAAKLRLTSLRAGTSSAPAPRQETSHGRRRPAAPDGARFASWPATADAQRQQRCQTMIGSLRGRLLARGLGAEMLVEVAGVGYRVHVTPQTAAAAGEVGTDVFVHVCHVVREDAQTLYGFLALDERETFETLIGTRGVGPASAMGILGVHSPEALRAAVAADDSDALCLAPGVGPKTALRLLIELKPRLRLPDPGTGPAVAAAGSDNADSAARDVRAALGGLGYGPDEISRAVSGLPDTDAQGMLREALRRLAPGAEERPQ